MGKQSAVDSLKETIRLLEIRQAEEGKMLKDQFIITYESLKPVNLIKSTIQELADSVEVKNNLFDSLLGVLSGYLSRSIVTSKSNLLMKILRVFAHFGITNVIINNSEAIRNYLANLISGLFTPKEESPETEV